MSPSVRYAGVIRFEVPQAEYRRLFDRRRTFGLTSTTQPDYAARQRQWLNFVSGPGRGREANPTYDPAHMSWRHQRVDPPPDQGYDLIEGPMYKGVEGLPGTHVPPRSAFDPYAEGTELPQQVVWNHQRAMDVLNAATTTLTQFDAANNCRPVIPPVSVPARNESIAEDAHALEEAQRELTDRGTTSATVPADPDAPCPSCHAMQREWERERSERQFDLFPPPQMSEQELRALREYLQQLQSTP
jgi:hypothetical protein